MDITLVWTHPLKLSHQSPTLEDVPHVDVAPGAAGDQGCCVFTLAT